MSISDDFNPWLLAWEPKHIRRFWNWFGSNPAFNNLYFSKMVGDAILDRVGAQIPLSGNVIDLGAGPGYLVEKLLHNKINTLAIDVSAESIALIKKHFQEDSFFLGARVNSNNLIPAEDGYADVLFFIEAIEHLDDFILHDILNEMRRVIKPAGYVVITTPNQEDLAESQIMCPNCGCIFHRVQHMRSFSQITLSGTMERAGFKEILCRPTLFSQYPKYLRYFHFLGLTLTGKKLPHLIYIGHNT